MNWCVDMLKSTSRCISFFSESVLHSCSMNNRYYMRFKHYKVSYVKGDEKYLDPEPCDERRSADFSPHCAFIAKSQAKFAKNARRKYKMKKFNARTVINLDSSSSSESRSNDRLFSSQGLLDKQSPENLSGNMLNNKQDFLSNPNNPINTGSGKNIVIPDDFRKWETVDVKSKRKTPDDGLSIKVMSYNVLAQYLLESHSYLYRRCPSNALRWKVRSELLYKEICNLDPDIICLQEVQESHLENFYINFNHLGYHGIFKKRTGIRQDGCAIYFKTSLFEMLDQSNIEFYQPELPILNRDNIGLMVKLLPRSMKSAPFVVATTHLLYNPRRTDVRLAQMQVFLAEIDRFSYCHTGPDEKRAMHLPTIMTGDLNSIPASPVHSLVTKGQVGCDREMHVWGRLAVTDQCQHLGVYLNRKSGLHSTDRSLSMLYHSENERKSMRLNMDGSQTQLHTESFTKFEYLFNSGNIEHSLGFESVYNHRNENEKKEATTFQDFWITVDYIFYSTKSVCGELVLLERLKLPTAEECDILQCLPNYAFGSDHLSLMAKFLLKPPCK